MTGRNTHTGGSWPWSDHATSLGCRPPKLWSNPESLFPPLLPKLTTSVLSNQRDSFHGIEGASASCLGRRDSAWLGKTDILPLIVSTGTGPWKENSLGGKEHPPACLSSGIVWLCGPRDTKGYSHEDPGFWSLLPTSHPSSASETYVLLTTCVACQSLRLLIYKMGAAAPASKDC